MKYVNIAWLGLCLIAPALRADSIDDAEAKRRGVPVTQVQAEKVLAAEKLKGNELEKKLAALQKELASLEADARAAEVTSAVSAGAAGAAQPAGSLYDFFVKRYLDGQWATLLADMRAKKPEINALPAKQAEDLVYIMATVEECRPAWFDQAKPSSIKEYRGTAQVFKTAVNFTYHEGDNDLELSVKDNQIQTGIRWKKVPMDAKVGWDPRTEIPRLPADADVSLGDILGLSIWSQLGRAAVMNAAGPGHFAELPAESRAHGTGPYEDFWSFLASTYYGAPGGRRFQLGLAALSFSPLGRNNFADHALEERTWLSGRGLGAMLLVEVLSHRDEYPSLRIGSGDLAEDLAAGAYPETAALQMALGDRIMRNKLTLAEDRSMRNAIKAFAEANSDWEAKAIELPNGTKFNLDTQKDLDEAKERNAWIVKHLKAGDPAVPPAASKPGNP